MTQPGILASVPPHARFMFFDLTQPEIAKSALETLNARSWKDDVIGFGAEFITQLGKQVPGFTGFPRIEGAKVPIPITQSSLLVILRGDDPGDLITRGGLVSASLSPAFVLKDCENAFKYGTSRDLTGYEDGTENPEDRATEVALIHDQGPGLDGGSLVAVQVYEHNLDHFRSLDTSQQDNIFGRRISDNQEFDEAPETAHVKRVAQESFEPEAFLIRRSMPYHRGPESGLVFVGYGSSLASYTALLTRMVGAEDGQTDLLFSFTTPKKGGAYFCPPKNGDVLDLSALL